MRLKNGQRWAIYLEESRQLFILTPWFGLVASHGGTDFLNRSYWWGIKWCSDRQKDCPPGYNVWKRQWEWKLCPDVDFERFA